MKPALPLSWSLPDRRPALLTAGAVLFILLALKPFGINYQHPDFYYFGLLAGYGLAGLLAETALQMLLPLHACAGQPGRFALRSGLLLLAVSLLVWPYSHLLHALEPRYHFPAFSYPEALFKAWAVGLIPVAVQALLLRKPAAAPAAAQPQPAETAAAMAVAPQLPAAPALVQLTSADGKDWFRVEPGQLLYIVACDNYAEIHYRTAENTAAKRLLRATLSELEAQLTGTALHRCHRSYIVNLDRVREATGNGKALALALLGSPERIPVSRARISYFQQLLRPELPG